MSCLFSRLYCKSKKLTDISCLSVVHALNDGQSAVDMNLHAHCVSTLYVLFFNKKSCILFDFIIHSYVQVFEPSIFGWLT